MPGDAANKSPDDAGELVIGLVGPVGSNLPRLEASLERTLERYAYRNNIYRLSDLFLDEKLDGRVFPRVSLGSTYERLRTSMDAGDILRDRTKTPEIMAIHAASSIAAERHRDDDDRPSPMARTAHVLHSLKRPEEVELLRRLYGHRFVLISVYAPREARIASLREAGMTEAQAVELVDRDERSEGRYGQETSATFERADLFVDTRRLPEELDAELLRFFDLLFGPDAITLRDDVPSKVRFLPFVGIGPRRYVDLFALRDAYGSRIRRKGKDGGVARWERSGAVPALQTRLVTYLTLEERAARQLEQALARAVGKAEDEPPG